MRKAALRLKKKLKHFVDSKIVVAQICSTPEHSSSPHSDWNDAWSYVSKLNKPELEVWATVHLCSGGLMKENPILVTD